MEKITMIGTGAAMVTTCYNTCFTISDDATPEFFLVDGGGGNGILSILEQLHISVLNIHNAFVSHNHSDHILGMVWMIRAITQHINRGRYEGNFNIYAHQKSIDAIRTISCLVMQKKLTAHFDSRIIFHPVEDKSEADILNWHFKFFNIQSTKELQHGFTCCLSSGKRITFLGDEPYNDYEKQYAEGVDLLMQEAYCLYAEHEKFRPYEKHHGTVLDSCRNAANLNVKATLLFHTEGKTPMSERKTKYTAEGATVFNGKIFVPDDKEVIEL